jgi:hypothetical protein
MVAFLLMSSVFLVSGIAGWYVANAATIRFGRDKRT